MKKVLAILSAIILFSSCRKEIVVSEVDQSKNPLLISVSVNGTTSEIVRVK